MESINLDPIFKTYPDPTLGFCDGYRLAPWRYPEEKIYDLIQRGQAFLRTPTGRVDSYYLKNEMERLTGGPGTISHGALICGAVLMGIGVIRDAMNGLLFVDRRSLRKKGLING